MDAVECIDLPSPDRVVQLAMLSASMDGGRPSKFAIFAPQDLAYGLGRIFQIQRGLERSSTKEVGVFRTLGGAMAFLGIEEKPQPRAVSNRSPSRQ